MAAMLEESGEAGAIAAATEEARIQADAAAKAEEYVEGLRRKHRHERHVAGLEVVGSRRYRYLRKPRVNMLRSHARGKQVGGFQHLQAGHARDSTFRVMKHKVNQKLWEVTW